MTGTQCNTRNGPLWLETKYIFKILITPLRCQAVMELGATVCTVHQPPSCASCPLRSVCQAYADVLRSPASAVPVTSYPAKVGACRTSRNARWVLAFLPPLTAAGGQIVHTAILKYCRNGQLLNIGDLKCTRHAVVSR